MEPLVNLQFLKRSNKKPQVGDVFCLKVPTGHYLFGRVIFADVDRNKGPMPTANLVYIYNYQSDVPVPNHGKMLLKDLLIAPVWTNRMGWTRGYFRTLENRPLLPSDVPPVHCFWDSVTKRYFDNSWNVLPSRSEPCGSWGLVSYRWIDDHVSDALGIPRVPVDPNGE